MNNLSDTDLGSGPTTINIDVWMTELSQKLVAQFGDRLVLVGLQGSRARGEARADSDIDVVVIIDGLTRIDIRAYHSLLAQMPHASLACGFISSPAVLAAWPRHDSMNLVLDTKPIHGSFDFMDADFTAEDARLSAKAGAAEIYHLLAHATAFDEMPLEDAVAASVKASFFVMRALAFATTGEYPVTRARMKELASDEELRFLRAYDDVCANTSTTTDLDDLATRLMDYAARIIMQ